MFSLRGALRELSLSLLEARFRAIRMRTFLAIALFGGLVYSEDFPCSPLLVSADDCGFLESDTALATFDITGGGEEDPFTSSGSADSQLLVDMSAVVRAHFLHLMAEAIGTQDENGTTASPTSDARRIQPHPVKQSGADSCGLEGRIARIFRQPAPRPK